MKTAKTVALAGIITLCLGCGYSKPMTTPPQPGAKPIIAQLVPASTSAGSAFQLEVDGTSFSSNAVINFNGAAQTTTADMSATKLTAMIPASAVMNAGTVLVTVTNPGTPGGPYGGGTSPETSSPVDFTIN